MASPRKFVFGTLRLQRSTVVAAAIASIFGMVPGALIPYVMGRGIDDGILAGNRSATIWWSVALLALVASAIFAEQLRNILAVSNWLNAMFRVVDLVARKVTQMGHVIVRRVPTGELLSIAGSDSDQLGAFAEVVGRFFASLFVFALVTVLVLQESVKLGLVVLIAAPLVVLSAIPFLKPMQRKQATERERSSVLTGQATDIVGGLRILRGIGGEKTFGDNYAEQSQRVRRAGVAAQTWFAGIDSLRVFLSGGLLVILTYLGSQELLAGRLTTGQLVAFFGYALFLVQPITTFYETAMKYTQTTVGANKIIASLSQEPPWEQPANPVELPAGDIVDHDSGVVAKAGELTILVSQVPDETAAIADRIGRYLPAETEAERITVGDGLKRKEALARNKEKIAARAAIAKRDEDRATSPWNVTVGGVDLTETTLGDTRETILVSEPGGAVFSGTLQELIDPDGKATREQAEQALFTASAEDVWEALPGGWQGVIDERGRGLSGGQRQRLVLARALVADPKIMVLVEPTSAVDAHTEARIAERLPELRAGKTTVLTTASPLWLHHGDRVVLVIDGKAIAAGTHAELLTDPRYRAIVARGEDD